MITEDILSKSVKGLEYCEKGGILDEYLSSPEIITMRKTISFILFNYFRYKGVVDYFIRENSNKQPKQHLNRILSVSLTQIIFQSAIPNSIIVDVAVSYTKKKEGIPQSKFINAILRKAVLVKEDFQLKIDTLDLTPPILKKRWKKSYSEKEILEIENAIKEQPSITFRIKSEEQCDDFDFTELKTSNFTKIKFYSVSEGKELFTSESMKCGKIYVQDSGATMLTTFLPDISASSILDMCSAPGGKTMLLSELFPTSKIIATDKSEERLDVVRENIERFKAPNVSIKNINNLDINMMYDLVLLDVPCTNTGVIRHRPDVMWGFSEKKLHKLLEIQKNILEAACDKVKGNGYILYSTCSIEPEENQGQIKNFCSKYANFELIRDKLLLPSKINDGAYLALLKKIN